MTGLTDPIAIALLEKHSLAELKRDTTRFISSARRYDRRCRDVKYHTRKLKQLYWRLRTAKSETAWRQQFGVLCQLY